MPMDTAFSHQKEREQSQPPQLKLCLPLTSTFRRVQYNVMVISSSVFCAGSPCFLEDRKIAMEDLIQKNQVMGEKMGKKNGGKIETFGDLNEDKCRESGSSSDFLSSETPAHVQQSPSSTDESSSSPSIRWPFQEMPTPSSMNSHKIEDGGKKHLNDKKFQKKGSGLTEIEMMKERFAKLLLGEDMSGCGNGVSTALAVSNAITNLCATLFGQIWRLEPVPQEKKVMWRREMEWLLSVSDHIVELAPTWQTFPDGSKLEVMSCRPRSDLYVNLPALRKLDNMLIEILDSFVDTDFWYVDEGLLAPEADGSFSFRTALQRQEEKWWLPVPRVPTCGLDDDSRKKLQQKRDSTNQILKAAMAINSITLADMDIPESYLESLPKNARVSLGDIIYQYISTDQFSPECLLECLDLSSQHQAIEIADRVEAAIYIWRRRTNARPASNTTRYSSRSSWGMVKDLMLDTDKTELLAEKAESLLLSLKRRFPGLPQTALDTSKIQHNKDVGKAILESYSRVLESLAYNIVARIEDVLYVDDLTKHSDQLSRLSKAGLTTHKPISVPYSTPVPSSPYKSGFTTPSFSPAPVTKRSSISSSDGDLPKCGGGAKKVLTDYLSIDNKGKQYNSPIKKVIPTSKMDKEEPAFRTDLESSECTEEGLSPKVPHQAWE